MKFIFRNFEEDLIQKTAWRLVRSAEDRLGADRGNEKRVWCIERIRELFPKKKHDDLDDHVRSAFINFRAEQKSLVL